MQKVQMEGGRANAWISVKRQIELESVKEEYAKRDKRSRRTKKQTETYENIAAECGKCAVWVEGRNELCKQCMIRQRTKRAELHEIEVEIWQRLWIEPGREH